VPAVLLMVAGVPVPERTQAGDPADTDVERLRVKILERS